MSLIDGYQTIMTISGIGRIILSFLGEEERFHRYRATIQIGIQFHDNLRTGKNRIWLNIRSHQPI